MNEGVKILLERIKTNPEEFTEGSKWSHLIQSHKMFLNEEDSKALEDALNGLMQQRFTERVMKELLAPEEDDSLGKQWFTAGKNVTLSAGQTQGVTLSSVAGTGYQWGTISVDPLVQAHIDAHNAVLKKEKKHQTLFGRLFNYQ
jgi:hypothetical protein